MSAPKLPRSLTCDPIRGSELHDADAVSRESSRALARVLGSVADLARTLSVGQVFALREARDGGVLTGVPGMASLEALGLLSSGSEVTPLGVLVLAERGPSGPRSRGPDA